MPKLKKLIGKAEEGCGRLGEVGEGDG